MVHFCVGLNKVTFFWKNIVEIKICFSWYPIIISILLWLLSSVKFNFLPRKEGSKKLEQFTEYGQYSIHQASPELLDQSQLKYPLNCIKVAEEMTKNVSQNIVFHWGWVGLPDFKCFTNVALQLIGGLRKFQCCTKCRTDRWRESSTPASNFELTQVSDLKNISNTETYLT